MSFLAPALAGAALVLAADAAFAHPQPLGIGGFAGGVLHPLFVSAHVLAILALGLLVGQQTQWGRAAPFAFIAALAAGLGVMTFGFVPKLLTEALLLLAAAAGLLVALARPMPEPVGAALAAAGGFAIALDSPPEVISVREANFMLIGTGFGATVLMIAAVEAASRLKPRWLGTGARIAGSWIAAAAILTLVLLSTR